MLFGLGLLKGLITFMRTNFRKGSTFEGLGRDPEP